MALAGLLMMSLLLAACGSDEPTATPTLEGPPGASNDLADDGETISVHYTGTLDDGTQFDSSRERDPLTFTLGAGQLIAGFENAVRGMALGASVTVRIPPEDGYGLKRDDAFIEMATDQLPGQMVLGDRVELAPGVSATVVEMNDSTVTFDANHPLAGQALNFDIEIVSIE